MTDTELLAELLRYWRALITDGARGAQLMVWLRGDATERAAARRIMADLLQGKE